MTPKKTSPSLRLHVEPPQHDSFTLPTAALASLVSAFEQATGWPLRYEQAPPGIGEVWSATIEADDSGGSRGGRLVLGAPPPAEKPLIEGSCAVEFRRARPLALSIASLVREVATLKQELRQREAELAAGVPVIARPAEEPHLAERLEAVLKSGAEAVGCQAAGLYLLDECTSALKLRAAFGLPQDRLLAQARPLRGAMADLEALVGHAVVLEDTSLLPHWRCPEDFPSAVCVPVSSPSMPLGTLWVFGQENRDFTPQETNLLEIVAGRLAAELEREMLIAAGTKSKRREQQFDAAISWQADRSPRVAPLLDDYTLAGWQEPAGELSGEFYDWSVMPDGRLFVAIGGWAGSSLEGSLSAASLRMALKAHATYGHSASELLARVNESLISASPGEEPASLGLALLDPASGRLELALAGQATAIVASGESHQFAAPDQPPLGVSPESVYATKVTTLLPGDVLILGSGGEEATAFLGQDRLHGTAAAIAEHVRRRLTEEETSPADQTVIVLARRQEIVKRV